MKKKYLIFCVVILTILVICGSIIKTNMTQSESELQKDKTRILINKEYSCEIFDDFEKNPNIICDINTLLWIIPRGGAGITDEGKRVLDKENSIIRQSKQCLENYQTSVNENWYQDTNENNTWIRIIDESYIPQEGENGIGHKDIVIYREESIAFFAVQNPEESEIWTVWEMPNYGVWFEKEIDMFLRMFAGI